MRSKLKISPRIVAMSGLLAVNSNYVVVNEIKNDASGNLECKQCGACMDYCPKYVWVYGLIEGKENDYGKGKKD